MSFKARAASLSILLFISILPYSSAQPVILINQVAIDDLRDIYVVEVRQSNIPESQNKLVSIEIICKNNKSTPESCWTLESFELLDEEGRDYQPNSDLSDVSEVRIAAGDTIRSIVSFVMTSQATPTQLLFDESPSEFKIDLTQYMTPSDKAPESAWVLTRNMGKEVGDGIMEMNIISESFFGSQLALEIIMKNIGYKEIDYDLRKFYLKDEKGFVYSDPLLPDKKLREGNLQPEESVRRNISFEIKHPSDHFMVVYDKSPSFLSTGDSMTKPAESQPFEVPVLTVGTEKIFYAMGEIVKINGIVSEVASIGGSMFIMNPDNEEYTRITFYPNPDHSFQTQFELKEDGFASEGIWTVKVVYLTNTVEAEFTVMEKETWISMGLAYTSSALVVSEPKLVDENGKSGIHSVELNSVVGIESEVSNISSNELKFTYIVQIKNEEGITVSILLVGNSVLPNDSVRVELFWSPNSYGGYQAEVFLWESLSNPVPLTPLNRIGFNVPVKSIEGSVEISARVSQSSDDAEESISTGNISLKSSDLELVDDGAKLQLVGMRFQNLQIPQGATITSVRIYFTVDQVDKGQTNLAFYAEDVDDAPEFTTTTNDISSRTKTTASVDWNNVPSWDTIDVIVSTPDLSTVIQRIVDRPGWTIGNSIVFIVSGSGERTAESYDGEPENAALLVVDWII